MTPFNENITKSIDNLNEIEKNINLVFGDKLSKDIDNMMIENIIQKSGININIKNTVQNGKFDWHLVGNCETIDSIIKPVTGLNKIRVFWKNLIPFINQDFSLNNIHYYVKNGSLFLNGKSVGETSTSNINFINNFSFKLKAGKYYMRGNSTIGSYLKRKKDNSMIFTNPSYVAENTREFTLTEETELYIGFYIINQTLNDFNTTIMISTKPESYEPYTEESFDLHLGNIELAAVDNYKDRIVGKPNDWKILKNVEKNSDGTYSILEITQEIPIIDPTLNYELNHLYYNAIAYEEQTNIESIPESGNATMIIDVDAFVTKKEE